VASVLKFLRPRNIGQLDRPSLELSGPALVGAFEALVSGCEPQGGIERYIDALKLKTELFQSTLESVEQLQPDALKGLCAFMASVRRRVGAHLEKPAFDQLHRALIELLEGARDTSTAVARIEAFCACFPEDNKHRWVRDLAGEILHGTDPERYPLMCRWVWDAKANTGVIREIWHGDDVDGLTIPVPDGYPTYLMLREELSQFLTNNGVFSDVLYYVDLLCAQVYANYIGAQGSCYLRADFSTAEDPMQHTRRLLGLDGVKAGSQRTRLKTIDGKAFVLDEVRLLE
jgi:hypothetical protein